MTKALALLGGTVLAFWINPVGAVNFTAIDPTQSKVEFLYTQMGVGMEGSFSKYQIKLAFDPAKPETATAVMDVQLASVDAGYAEANSELAGKDWFDTPAYPIARFESTSVKALAGNQYQLNGKLTIKGRTREISTPVTVTFKGNQGLFEGAFSFNRSEFSIGKGVWADPSVVADRIQIRFRLRAIEK